MKVYSIQPFSRQSTIHSKVKPAKMLQNQTFNGLKGAGIGSGVGLLCGGTMLGFIAIGAPYLLPIVALNVAGSSAAVGAMIGHVVEEDHSKNDENKDNNK